MRRFRLYLIWALLCLAAANVRPCAAEQEQGYIPLVRSAVGFAAQGLTREAFPLLAQALDYDPDDPLARVALGYIYSVGAKEKEAAAQYQTALKKKPDCAHAAYGLAMLSLNGGKPEDVLVALTNAQGMDDKLNMRGTLEYVKYLCTQTTKDFSAIDPLSKLVQAYALAGAGKHSEAIEQLRQLQEGLGIPAYKENLGLSASFDSAKPTSAKAWPLRSTDVLQTLKQRNIEQVQGVLTLKVDLKPGDLVRMVTFQVDERVVCITNQPPFQYSWDTTRAKDGPHTLTIQGCAEDTTVVSTKSNKVFVKNLPNGTAALGEPENYAQAWKELWEVMQIKPSSVSINYRLALSALEVDDKASAEAALENIMAINPDYKDTRQLLMKLRDKSNKDVKLYKSRAGGNVVALTFDDGPKESMLPVLQTLKENDVKATFFVVGKQVEIFPEILKALHADGHEIQNHTFNHSALSFLTKTDIEKEYFSTSCVVRSVIGQGTSAIRPPGGRSGAELYEFLRQYGVDMILWSVNCGNEELTNPEKLTDCVTRQVRPGAIILLHHENVITQRALPEIIKKLRAKRFEFVTISDFLAK